MIDAKKLGRDVEKNYAVNHTFRTLADVVAEEFEKAQQRDNSFGSKIAEALLIKFPPEGHEVDGQHVWGIRFDGSSLPLILHQQTKASRDKLHEGLSIWFADVVDAELDGQAKRTRRDIAIELEEQGLTNAYQFIRQTMRLSDAYVNLKRPGDPTPSVEI